MNSIEKQIARAVANNLIVAGHSISVDYERGFDCEEGNADLRNTTQIITASDAVDECWWMIDGTGEGEERTYDSFIYFVWGNGNQGKDCISNYSMSLERFIKPVAEWVDTAEIKLEGKPEGVKQ